MVSILELWPFIEKWDLGYIVFKHLFVIQEKLEKHAAFGSEGVLLALNKIEKMPKYTQISTGSWKVIYGNLKEKKYRHIFIQLDSYEIQSTNTLF